MPYRSKAQAGFFHTNPEKVGGAKVVAEWDKSSKGKKMPDRAGKLKKHLQKSGFPAGQAKAIARGAK